METKRFTVYVTPAGFCCTCGTAKSTLTGAQAARDAAIHKNHFHLDLNREFQKKALGKREEVTIIDYRMERTS